MGNNRDATPAVAAGADDDYVETGVEPGSTDGPVIGLGPVEDDVDFFRQVVETAPDGIVVVDAEGIIRLVNSQAERFFGWDRQQLIGQALEVLVPDQVRDKHPGHRLGYATSPRTRPMGAGLELTARRADGSEVPVDISLSPFETRYGMWVSAAVRDATLRKEVVSQLRHAYEQVNLSMSKMQRRGEQLVLVGEMGEMLQSCPDAEEAYAVVTAFMADLFPDTSGVIYRRTPSRAVLEAGAQWGDVADAMATLNANSCWALRRGRPHGAGSGRHSALRCHHDNAAAASWALCVPLLANGEVLGLMHLYANQTDQTDQTESELVGDGRFGQEMDGETQRLAVAVAEHLSLALASLALRKDLLAQSERDGLTGLYNRRHLDQTLAVAALDAAQQEQQISLLLIDVDRFKDVNDRDGHAAGDTLLRSLAHLLLRETRGSDTVFRQGGDEFAVLLPDTTGTTAVARAEQLRSNAEKTLMATVSIGVGTLRPSVGRSAEDLLRDADLCMYRAKALGRNQVVGPSGMPSPHPDTDALVVGEVPMAPVAPGPVRPA